MRLALQAAIYDAAKISGATDVQPPRLMYRIGNRHRSAHVAMTGAAVTVCTATGAAARHRQALA